MGCSVARQRCGETLNERARGRRERTLSGEKGRERKGDRDREKERKKIEGTRREKEREEGPSRNRYLRLSFL